MMARYENMRIEYSRTFATVGGGDEVVATVSARDGQDMSIDDIQFTRRLPCVAKMERLLRKLATIANVDAFPEEIAAKREARAMLRELDDADLADEPAEEPWTREDYDNAEACDRFHRQRDMALIGD